MAIDTVIFDLDGTLVDSIEDLAVALNLVLAADGLPTHDLPTYRQMIGEGARRLVELGLPEHKRGELDAYLARFRTTYFAHILDHTALYDGIDAMLDQLVAAGLRLAVLSNKPEAMTVHIGQALLSRWPFLEIHGDRDGIPRKPHPGGTADMLARMGATPETAAFVGDTKTDMQTARALGMTAIGVSWGFRGTVELWQSGANVVIDHPRQLFDAIEAASGR